MEEMRDEARSGPVVAQEIRQLVRPFVGEKGTLIAALQQLQSHYGYVPAEAIPVLAEELGVLPVDVYGILTFYAQFSMEPRGRHTIRVCQGTACYVMGGRMLLEQLQEDLGIQEGETTPDGRFTLETVACLGCCGMAPVVTVDDEFYGNVTTKKLAAILDRYPSGQATDSPGRHEP